MARTWTVAQLQAEYRRLLHAMQTGVAYAETTVHDSTPKHLRVGVNAAMCSHAALAHVLIEKGLITEHEYWMGQCEAMREEVERYQEAMGPGVTIA